jgi:hypothetical protein
MDTKGGKAPRRYKNLPGALDIGTFWKLLLMTSSRWLGVMWMDLPSYTRDNNS